LTINISKNYTSLGANPPKIGSDEVDAITAILGNLGALYDSTWNPAIHSLLVNNSRSLDGAWVDGIGIALYPAVSGYGIQSQYAYKAYIDAMNPSKEYVQNLTISDPVLKKFTTLDLSLYLRFGLSGFYINARIIQNELFNATDGYVHRLTQFTPQLMSVASTQLPGKSFGGLYVSVLDGNVVHVATYLIFGALAYSEYFGTGPASTTTLTETTISTATKTTISTPTTSITSGVLLTAGVLAAALVIVMVRRQK
jgi:hypothetical protein